MLNNMFTIVVIMSFGSFLISGEVTKSSDKEKSKTEKVKTKKVEMIEEKYSDFDIVFRMRG